MKLCSHAIYVIRQHQIKDQSLYLCQKFDLFSVYLNRELKVEKDVSAGSHFMPYML